MAYKNYKIRDNWLNIDKYNDVDIQSVDGVIQTVKVNGEDVGGGGSGDLSTATITLQNVGESTTRLSVTMGVCILESPSLMTGNYIDPMGASVSGGSTVNQKVVLYHGEVNVRFNAEEIVSVDGNIVAVGSGRYKVTGDCTVIARGSGSV